MNTQTFDVAVKSLDQILAEEKEMGHYWEVVKPESFAPSKWTLREVELTDSKLIPKAREEGEHILGSGLYVERFVLAEEIEKPAPDVPWGTIARVVGAIGFTIFAAYVGLGVISLIVGTIAMIVKAIAILVPTILVGMLVMAALVVDPALCAIVINEQPDGTKEEKWIQVAKWLH